MVTLEVPAGCQLEGGAGGTQGRGWFLCTGNYACEAKHLPSCWLVGARSVERAHKLPPVQTKGYR